MLYTHYFCLLQIPGPSLNTYSRDLNCKERLWEKQVANFVPWGSPHPTFISQGTRRKSMEEIDESQWTDMMFTHPHVPGEIMCHLCCGNTHNGVSFWRISLWLCSKAKMVRSTTTIHEVKQKEEVESSSVNDYLPSGWYVWLIRLQSEVHELENKISNQSTSWRENPTTCFRNITSKLEHIMFYSWTPVSPWQHDTSIYILYIYKQKICVYQDLYCLVGLCKMTSSF